MAIIKILLVQQELIKITRFIKAWQVNHINAMVGASQKKVCLTTWGLFINKGLMPRNLFVDIFLVFEDGWGELLGQSSVIFCREWPTFSSFNFMC